MEFRFEDKITALDVWKLSMYHVYRSLAGVCNVVFAVAIICATIKLWNPREGMLMSILLFCCVLFPVIQPLMIYTRAARQMAALPKDMVYEINESGIHIIAGNQKSHLTWNRVRGVIKEHGMVILATDAGRGYMLTDKTLGTQKDSFIEFLESKLEHEK